MTRLEQLKKKAAAKADAAAAKEKALHEALAKLREEQRGVSAEVKEEERRLTHKRRYHVGALVDAAGLFALDNATLQDLFAVLSRARQIPDLPQVLRSVLDDWLLPEEQHSTSALAGQVEALVAEL